MVDLTMKPRDLLPLLLAAVAIVALADGCAERRRADAATQEQNRLAGELLAERAAALGLTSSWAQERDSLAGKLEERGDSIGGLLGELGALRARLLTHTELEAVLRDSIEVLAQIHVDSAGPCPVVDSITAEVQDSVVEASIWCQVAPALCRLGLVVRPPLVLDQILAPDGRLLVVARSGDDRVEVSARTEYQLPPPQRICTLGQKAKTVAYSSGPVILLWELAQALAQR